MIRFTFVQKDPIPNLATMHLSAVLKDGGFDAQVVVAPAHRALLKTILRTEPDVVCFSATTGQHLWQMGVARAVKATIASMGRAPRARVGLLEDAVAALEGLDKRLGPGARAALGTRLGAAVASAEAAAVARRAFGELVGGRLVALLRRWRDAAGLPGADLDASVAR